MADFDYNLFHKFFERLYLFEDFITGYQPTKGAKVEDNIGGKDITSCLDLDIFSKMKDAKIQFGENAQLIAYKEFKKSGKTVGARGAIVTGMDWDDIDTPTYYYEFSHKESGDKVEEYFKELHIDDMIMNLSRNIDSKRPLGEKGSDEGKKLIEDLIQNSIEEDDADLRYKDLKYICIVEAGTTNIWKVGLHEGNYTLMMTGPQHLSTLNTTRMMDNYVADILFEKSKGSDDLPPNNFQELRLQWNDTVTWYNKGTVDLDPSMTASKQKETLEKKRKELADRIYTSVLKQDFSKIQASDLEEILPTYTPVQIALMNVASNDTPEHSRIFGQSFIDGCSRYCKDKLDDAYRMIKATGKE